jgi:glycine cleavage system H protein
MAEIFGYDMPDGLHYHAEHAWAKVDDDGNVIVGMNDMYQKTSGDIVYVDMPMEGDEIEAGDVVGKVQSSKWIGKLVAPISGEVTEVNDNLDSDCSLINKDPYGEGWIFKVQPSKLDEELGGLMKGDAVEPWLAVEVEKSKKGAEGAQE